MSLSVYKPNPFAYPGNRLPGIDPTHPAASGYLTLSLANQGNGGASTNIGLSRELSNIGNAPASFGVDTYMGPFAKWNGGKERWFPGSTISNTSVGYTQAIIFKISLTNNALIVADVADTNDQQIVWMGLLNGGSTFSFRLGIGGGSNSQYDISSPAPVADVPYFFAISGHTTLAVTNWAITRLDTGQIYSGTFSTPSTDANFIRDFFLGEVLVTTLNTVKTATGARTSAYLTLPQLQAWAADPWAFWYPRTLTDTMNNSTASVIAAASNNPIYPKFINHASLLGMAAAGAVISNPKVTRRLGLPRRGKKR